MFCYDSFISSSIGIGNVTCLFTRFVILVTRFSLKICYSGLVYTKFFKVRGPELSLPTLVGEGNLKVESLFFLLKAMALAMQKSSKF